MILSAGSICKHWDMRSRNGSCVISCANVLHRSTYLMDFKEAEERELELVPVPEELEVGQRSMLAVSWFIIWTGYCLAPTILRIMCRCSVSSWVANSNSPLNSSANMHPMDHTSEGYDHFKFKITSGPRYWR